MSKRHRFWAIVMAVSCAACSYRPYRYGASPALGNPQQPAGDRVEIFVSDLHLGLGKTGGAWDAYEDFRWTPAFHDFLQHLRGIESAGKIDLVLLGDVIELWQYRDDVCTGPKDYGCTEAESVQHAQNVIAAHKDDLAELGAFAKEGDNRVVIVPGNHDGALLFPAVAQAVVNATGSGAPRLTIAQGGFWLSNDGELLADHGHQIDRLNAYPEWPAPFVSNGVSVRIRRPWGEVFVREFYNQLEQKYEILDNLASEATAISYAKKVEGRLSTLKAAGNYVGMLMFKNSLGQLGGYLGDDKTMAKRWDVAAARSAGAGFLRDSAAVDANLAATVASLDGPELEQAAAALSDVEITGICDLRQAVHNFTENAEPGALRGNLQPLDVKECRAVDAALGGDEAGQADSLGSLLDRRTQDRVLADYLDARFAALRDAQVVSKGFRYYVYGHTHLAASPWEVPWPGGRITVANTGAWQRVADDNAIKRLAPKEDPAQVLTTAKLDQLPACYSAIVARRKPGGAGRDLVLRYWQYVNGRGSFEAGCNQ